MILSATATFRPDDGTPVGRALGDLNALLTAAAQIPGASAVRAAVFFAPAPAYLDVLDAEGAPVPAPPDLALLVGAAPSKPIAELVAASLMTADNAEGV